MEKGNLLPTKEPHFAVTNSVCFIWSTAKETLLTLKKEKVIRYVCCVVQQWSHCRVKHGKFGSFKTIICHCQTSWKSFMRTQTQKI